MKPIVFFRCFVAAFWHFAPFPASLALVGFPFLISSRFARFAVALPLFAAQTLAYNDHVETNEPLNDLFDPRSARFDLKGIFATVLKPIIGRPIRPKAGVLTPEEPNSTVFSAIERTRVCIGYTRDNILVSAERVPAKPRPSRI